MDGRHIGRSLSQPIESAGDSRAHHCRILTKPLTQLLLALAVVFALLSVGVQAFAQAPNYENSGNIESLMSKRGDVAFRKTSLAEAVFSLSEVWGVNIVAGGEVDGEVSGVFVQAPLTEVLDAILSANGYGYRISGQSLIIMPLEHIGTNDPNFVSQTLKLPGTPDQHESILKATEMLISDRGRVQLIPLNNSLLVIDNRANVTKVADFIGQLGNAGPANVNSSSPTNTFQPQLGTITSGPDESIMYFAPQFVSAEELQGPMTDALGDGVRISIMVEENRLMVLGNADQLRIASQIVDALDIPRLQVRIAALIYDVELRRGEELGIDWGNTLSVNGSFGGAAVDTTTTAATTGTTGTDAGSTAAAAAATGVAVTLGTLQDTLTLGNVIRALDETRGAHLLADPTITVADRREASIKIVTKIPFQQLTQTQQGGNIGTTAFQEAGITLTVTPRIARDGTIQMKVRPEFSTLVEYIDGQPLIDSRAAETDVRIADRHTLVIGGLRRKQMRDAVAGIPGLMNIRKIGRLFGAHESGITESELLVFLRPEIISPYQGLDPRSSAAACVGGVELDAIPVADFCPMVPDCKDPCCVYHHRRRNVNPGAPTLYPFENGMIGDFGLAEPEPIIRYVEEIPVPVPN